MESFFDRNRDGAISTLRPILALQLGSRQALAIENSPIPQLPAEIAVLVLVEFILNPELSFAQLAFILKRSKRVTVDVGK